MRIARRALVILMGLAPWAHSAWSDETCRYSGTTSYDGRVSVVTSARTRNGETVVNAAARVNARTFGIIDWQYLYQEIGVWRDGELHKIGINHRYSVGGSIRRQQWDVFTRAPDGMAADRVQANTLASLEEKHPGFVRHWNPAAFGEDFFGDFPAGAPDRRSDLDLPKTAMPPGLGTPLLLAFYWVRWAEPADRTVPVFLPGFKRDARVDVRVVPVGVEVNGVLHLRSSARHKQLSQTEASTGDAWIAPDHRLIRVTFEAHGDRGTAQGDLHLEGCAGQTGTR